jgi:hypothetical protein
MSERHNNTMVFCHDGSRSLAVVIMYLILRRGKTSEHPTFFNYWTPWDTMLKELGYKAAQELPPIHNAHKQALDRLPLALMETLL